MGPNLVQLLESYWDRQRIVPNTGKFLGKEFRAGRVSIQGDPVYPITFNIVVDVLVWAVIDVV